MNSSSQLSSLLHCEASAKGISVLPARVKPHQIPLVTLPVATNRSLKCQFTQTEETLLAVKPNIVSCAFHLYFGQFQRFIIKNRKKSKCLLNKQTQCAQWHSQSDHPILAHLEAGMKKAILMRSLWLRVMATTSSPITPPMYPDVRPPKILT